MRRGCAGFSGWLCMGRRGRTSRALQNQTCHCEFGSVCMSPCAGKLQPSCGVHACMQHSAVLAAVITKQRSVTWLAVAAAAASKIALAGWLATMSFLETGQTPVAPENIFRRTTISLYILKYILVSIVRNNQCRRFTFFLLDFLYSNI